MTVAGRRGTAFCGPASVAIEIGGHTYTFVHGLCDRSATMGALEIDAGTRVPGAAGNAGRPFVSLVIAQSPSESQAFEAFWSSHQLFTDTVIAQRGSLLGAGTFASLFGTPLSGSWNCHGVIFDGP